MAESHLFIVLIEHPRFGGDRVRVCGQGTFVDEALKDAAAHIAPVFRPKQDGREPILSRIAMERPDGSRYTISKEELKAKLEGLTPANG